MVRNSNIVTEIIWNCPLKLMLKRKDGKNIELKNIDLSIDEFKRKKITTPSLHETHEYITSWNT